MAMRGGINLIRVSQPDDQAIVLGLTRFANDLEDFRGYFTDRLEPLLIAAFDEVFATEGSGGRAGAWPPLTDAYAKRKAFKYPGQPILVATGDLRNMMTDETQFVSQALPLEYIVFTSKIGIYHQRGTRDERLPMRQFFSLTDEDKLHMAKNLHTWAYEHWLDANKENFRSAAISDYDTAQAAKRKEWA